MIFFPVSRRRPFIPLDLSLGSPARPLSLSLSFFFLTPSLSLFPLSLLLSLRPTLVTVKVTHWARTCGRGHLSRGRRWKRGGTCNGLTDFTPSKQRPRVLQQASSFPDHRVICFQFPDCVATVDHSDSTQCRQIGRRSEEKRIIG